MKEILYYVCENFCDSILLRTVPVPLRSVIKLLFRFRCGKMLLFVLLFRFRNTDILSYFWLMRPGSVPPCVVFTVGPELVARGVRLAGPDPRSRPSREVCAQLLSALAPGMRADSISQCCSLSKFCLSLLYPLYLFYLFNLDPSRVT
jgi:hypothetical protein